MTREVAHYKMFEAALDSIPNNFPPGVLAADPRFTQQAFNLSNGTSVRGPWNEGEIPGMGKEWIYVEKPLDQIQDTEGQTKLPDDFSKELKAAEKLDKEMSAAKSAEVKDAEPQGIAQWSTYANE
jgi:Mn-containing catalase